MQETVARLIDANRRLTRANMELQTFFDQSFDLLVIAEDGRFTKLSKSWEDITGWTREELMSRPFAYFVHGEDVRKTIEEDNRLNSGENPTVNFVNRYRTKDGGLVKLQWHTKTVDGVSYAVARVIE